MVITVTKPLINRFRNPTDLIDFLLERGISLAHFERLTRTGYAITNWDWLGVTNRDYSMWTGRFAMAYSRFMSQQREGRQELNISPLDGLIASVERLRRGERGGYGCLSGDKRWNEFKVSINGQLKSLKDLGIASIDLTPTGSGQSFSDGSAIIGTTTFTRIDGTKGLVGDAILANDQNDYKIARSTAKNADGTSSELIVGYDKDGSVALRNLVTKNTDGSTVTTKFDDDGDSVFDRSQSKTFSIEVSGNRSETVRNFNADGSLSGSEKIDRSSDGLKITTALDKNGDGSADERQLFEKFADGSSRTTTQQLHLDGTTSKTVIINVSADGLRKTTSTDLNGDGITDHSVSDIKTPAPPRAASSTLPANSSTLPPLAAVSSVSVDRSQDLNSLDPDVANDRCCIDLGDAQEVGAAPDGQLSAIVEAEEFCRPLAAHSHCRRQVRPNAQRDHRAFPAIDRAELRGTGRLRGRSGL